MLTLRREVNGEENVMKMHTASNGLVLPSHCSFRTSRRRAKRPGTLFGMPYTGEQFVIRSFNPYQADDPGRCRRHSLGHCIGLYARSDLLNASTFLAADYYGDFAAGGSRVLRDAWLDQIDTIPATDLMEKIRTGGGGRYWGQ